MVGVRISGPEYQTVSQRLEKGGCANFYLQISYEFDTISGAIRSFKTKKEKFGSKKRNYLLSHKKRTCSQYVFAASNPNVVLKGQQNMQGERYFLSREAGHQRQSASAQNIRGVLMSSRWQKRRHFQPRTMLQFPVQEEIGKIRRAMPSNRQLVNGEIISLSISELVQWEVAQRSPYQMVPKSLNCLW